jgi:cell division protein FtsI/penicillin-binding protein 2
MAVMTAAIANGGKVLWPRLIDRLVPQDPLLAGEAWTYKRGRVRDELNVSRRTLDLIRDAMRADVEEDGTGKAAHIPGFRICGKTGTAQVTNPKGEVVDRTTWFAAFGPYEDPRYAVIVMVETGVSGGHTCAPIAREVFLALRKRDLTASPTASSSRPSTVPEG